MLRPKSIHIKDIVSHQDSIYHFKPKETFIIFGENLDTERPRSNGSGKSGFMEGLHIAYTGSPSRKLSQKKSIVRNDCSFGEVIHELVDTDSNHVHTIYWKIFSNTKSAVCELSSTDPLLDARMKQLTVVNEKKSFIFSDLLQITKEDFLNYYLIFKDSYTPFFSTGDVEQKKTINRFSNADLTDRSIEYVKLDLEDAEEGLTLSKNSIIGTEAKISLLDQQIEDVLNNASSRRTDEINSSLERIERYKNSSVEYSHKKSAAEKSREEWNKKPKPEIEKLTLDVNLEVEKLSDITKEGDRLTKEILDIDSTYLKSERVDGEKQLKESRVFYNDLDVSKKEVNLLISSLEKKLLGVITCPSCKHEFTLLGEGEDFDISDTRATLESLAVLHKDAVRDQEEVSEIINLLQQQLNSYQKDVEKKKAELEKIRDSKRAEYVTQKKKVDSKRDELEQAEDLQRQINTFVSKYSQEIKSSEIEVAAYQDLIAKEEEKLELLKSSKEEADTSSYKAKVKDLRKHLTHLNKQEKSAGDKVLELKEVLDHLKRFKSYLANQSIGTISGLTNSYLKDMKSELQVDIQGYKVNSDKTISEKISTQVLRNGFLEGEYGKFSGGERITMDLALILSLQGLINQSSPNGGLDMLVTDEIIESIDTVGVEDVTKGLNNLSSTTLHVTHAPFNSDFENKIIIRKENKISRII